MWINNLAPVLGILMTSLTMTQSVSACPYSCRCDSRRRVYCQYRNLTVVPYGIPSDTLYLNIQDNDLINSPTTNVNLAQLSQLRELKMYHNSLTSVPADLPSSLQYISLRNNRIRYIGKNAFHGMRSLVQIYLDGNNITNKGLSTLAFGDTISLEELTLSDNLFSSVPEGLPSSLRVLRLENNRIRAISASALVSLENLSTLDLSNNLLMRVPVHLPPNLEELLLSSNQIEYLYSGRESGFANLRRLRSLDLSLNNVRSVQVRAFANLTLLDTVSLHGNRWRCDCHLQYLKRWFSRTTSAVSNKQSIKCQSPGYLADVTIDSVDLEALRCDTRLNARRLLRIHKVTSHSMDTSWGQPQRDPPYVKKFMFFGPLACQNCSLRRGPMIHDVTKLVEQYGLVDFTNKLRRNPSNATVHIERLRPGTRYIVCVYDSQQEVSEIGLDQCADAWTDSLKMPPSTPGSYEKEDPFPSMWIVVIACFVTLLLVFVAVVAFVVVRKRRSSKKGPHPPRGGVTGYHTTRRDDFCYPESYLPGYTYAPAPTSGFGTTSSDRTYMECGEADATREFDVTIIPMKQNDVTTPKRLIASPSNSSASSSHYPTPTMSTNQTTAMGSRDSLDNLLNKQQHRPSPQHGHYETPMTTQLRHQTGIFV